MCLIETPYYHDCGHYGHQATIPNGRCIRADPNPCSTYGCWDTKDMGVRTINSACLACQRRYSEPTPLPSTSLLLRPEMRRNSAAAGSHGPIDVARFNSLVKLHQRTFERRKSIDSSTTSESVSTTISTALATSPTLGLSSTPVPPVPSAPSALSATPASSGTCIVMVQAHLHATIPSPTLKAQSLVRSGSGSDSVLDDLEIGRRRVPQSG